MSDPTVRRQPGFAAIAQIRKPKALNATGICKGKLTIQRQDTHPLSGEALLSLVETSLGDDKAQDVVSIRLTGKSDIADFMVIASGTSSRQVAAMAEHLRKKMKAGGLKTVAVEGAAQGDWVLIDGGDIIVHLFRPEVRDFYALEKMWGMDSPGRVGASA